MDNLKRIEKLKKIISKIPFEPGIYQMRDENDNIIYVGKAISLRKRVRQYFQKNVKSKRIEKMVSLVHNITYIVTKNEVEALVLECNYIKEFSPKFNVMLKDDKTYPYIKITIKEKYPTIYITRTKKDDGSMYFGPYTNVTSIREVLALIKKIFPLKRCKYNLEKNKSIKPCLYYYIGKCLGPCENDVNLEQYQSMIKQIIMFLQGKTKEIENEIIQEIDKCIEKLDFEKAGNLKKRLDDIENISKKQNVANLNETNSDVFGYVYYLNILHIQVFKIRDYKVVLNDNIKIDDVDKEEIEDILMQVISQYYINFKNEDIPKKIYIKLAKEELLTSLKDYLKDIKKSKVEVLVPKKGEKLKLIEMVENNIRINIEESSNNVMHDLREKLKLQYDINSIECYDISNLRNDYIVGCMIRYEDSKLNKKMYRKFKIKSTLEQNDPLCIYEVLSRRMKHKDEWPLPDLIFIDGGTNQLNAAKKAVIEEAKETVDMYGMIKNDKHKTDALIDIYGNKIRFEEDDKKLFNFITFLQDEVHRFVIKYHRTLRDKLN